MANNSQPLGAQSLWPPPAGSLGPQNFGNVQMQYRPMVPNQQGQAFISASSQQFRPVGQGMPSNVGMPGVQDLPPHFHQSMHPFPPRPNQPGHNPHIPYVQTNRPISSSAPLPGLGAPGATSYTFAPPSFGQPQNNMSVASHIPSMPQMHAPAAGQPWGPGGGQGAPPAMLLHPTAQQPPATSPASAANAPTRQLSSDWQEHESANGRRYYYNKKTKQSSWEKPSELMTPIEKADASTVWKEFSTSDGRKYYYNKVTKQSVWSIPEEMKLAREQALKAEGENYEEAVSGSQGSGAAVTPPVETPLTPAAAAASSSTTPTFSAVASSPVPVIPASSANTPAVAIPRPLGAPVPTSTVPSNDTGGLATLVTNPPIAVPARDVLDAEDGASIQHIEEAKRGMAAAGKINVTPLEEKAPDDEPFIYSSKQEAKSAFKALLESVNVQSDWTWEQAMREIINDRRYGALKTLGERKQAFNEYLGQRKKLEAEERRIRQKKAREEFTKMLEESEELTSSVKWNKAVTMFEKDERFKAVERSRDREDLFESFMVDLERKEKEKAAEEHKHNIAEYKNYLVSCDFIKVNIQWRKVVDRLEDDERCLRLEKVDRLLIYQDYIRDLEKEEEEGKKIQKEHTRRAERKNRDEFRKRLEGHVAAGVLTAKTHWRDYCLKVKDTSEYQAVASNTSGSTPRDLFEDVAEELETKYYEDKVRIKDVMKSGKVAMVSTWTFEDFKAAVFEDIGPPQISEINLELVYEELLERAKEKEEKEAKKRQRVIDDFTKLLQTFTEITTSSTWDECKPLVEESYEFKSVGEENSAKEIFEEYITHLQEKAKEKERKREEEKMRKEKDREEKEKRKEKDKKERGRERERDKGKERTKKDDTESDTADANDSYGHKDDKKREKDKERKHRKRHQSASDEVYSDKEEKESKRLRRHSSSDRKKSRKHAHSPESDGEGRHKKHKRDHKDSSRRNGGHEELEDGEVGEDGDIQQS